MGLAEFPCSEGAGLRERQLWPGKQLRVGEAAWSQSGGTRARRSRGARAPDAHDLTRYAFYKAWALGWTREELTLGPRSHPEASVDLSGLGE